MNNGADSVVKRNAILTATEALTLLASGKPETWDQYTRWELAFMERWRFAPPAAEELRLLEARGAPEPFYPWHPRMSPDGSDVWSYETEYAAPSRWIEGPYGRFKMGAPELARAVRAQHRRRLGCTISFTELAAMLRSELVEHRDRAVRWDRANTRLREAIVNKEATAWAVRADDPKQEHVALPSQVAFRAIQFRADEIEPDDHAPAKDFTALRVGSRWTQVRFYTAEIEAIWLILREESVKPEIFAWLTTAAEEFLVKTGSKPKRDILVADCVAALDCSYDEAELAQAKLPNHLRRGRGDRDRK